MRSVWKTNVISLQDFATAELSEIFSGRQPHQDVKNFRRFGNSVPIFRVLLLVVRLIEHDHHPEDRDRVSFRNVVKRSHLDAAVCPRKFHWKLTLCADNGWQKKQTLFCV